MPKKTNQAPSTVLQELVVRSLLIVFSVLLALFLDGIREQQKTTANLTTAYRSIRIELEANRDTLRSLVERHRADIGTLDAALQSGKDFTLPASAGILSLPDLQSTAWSTLEATGAATNLKFSDVYPFVRLYELQRSGVGKTCTRLADFLSQSGSSEKQRVAADLKTVRMLLHELCRQEQRLLDETNTVLDSGQNWRYLD